MKADWTQVLMALITTLGTVLTTLFASRAKTHSVNAADAAEVAKQSADVAVKASLSPPPGGA